MSKTEIGDGFTRHGFDLCGCIRVSACCTSTTGRKWAVVRIETADGNTYDIFASKRKHRIDRIDAPQRQGESA